MFSKDLPLLMKEIDKLLETNEPILVSIDGKSASGKSSLADALQEHYDCNVFHMDDFFLTPELRTKERLNELGGNVDYERFDREVIQKIFSKKSFKYNIYSCITQTFLDSDEVNKKKLNIIEGCYSMHPSLINNYNLKIFLDIDKETQLERILKRDGEKKLQLFINEWIPKENRYFEEMEIRKKCDIIVNNLC